MTITSQIKHNTLAFNCAASPKNDIDFKYVHNTSTATQMKYFVILWKQMLTI